MSERDARKITIIKDLLSGRFTNAQAAKLLGLSIRQVQRLKAEATAHGVMSILHKSRGRKPANALDSQTAATILRTYQTELPAYNFCHATDVFAEEKGIFVSVSTVSRLLKSEGIRSPKAKRRPKKHRSRIARKREGELAQMDASKYDWLSNGSYLHLHGAIDDATGRILALHFEKEETFEGYCELMLQMNRDGHLPREIYTDARSVFCNNKKQKLSLEEELAGKVESIPHFARALMDLNILLIIASSPQAKGGIERLWQTLQDRLTKDLRRKGITTMEAANAFLKQFIPYYNRKFAVPAVDPDKVYLPKIDEFTLNLILTKQETRKLDSGLSFSFQGQKYRLPLKTSHRQRVCASPYDTLIIATNRRIGLKVLYKGLALDPEPLEAIPVKKTAKAKPEPLKQKKTPSQNKARESSPWFKHSTLFYSDSRLKSLANPKLHNIQG
jgi:transposase